MLRLAYWVLLDDLVPRHTCRPSLAVSMTKEVQSCSFPTRIVPPIRYVRNVDPVFMTLPAPVRVLSVTSRLLAHEFSHLFARQTRLRHHNRRISSAPARLASTRKIPFDPTTSSSPGRNISVSLTARRMDRFIPSPQLRSSSNPGLAAPDTPAGPAPSQRARSSAVPATGYDPARRY